MKEKIEHYNSLLKDRSPEEVLEFFTREFPRQVVFSSSMGAEDQVITHIMAYISDSPQIFTLDTGRMFAETYDLIEKTKSRYNIPIKVYFPDSAEVEQMVNAKGVNLFYESIDNRKLCCEIRKIRPLQRALKGYKVWITGLRSQQSPTRKNLSMVQWDDSYQMVKVNPLIDWNEEQLWEYIDKHKIPYNSLHKRGFASIGCQPCTRSIEKGEDIRAGRWWWENPESKECGLHVKK